MIDSYLIRVDCKPLTKPRQMNTTLKQQIDAIGKAMEARSREITTSTGKSLGDRTGHLADPQWAALNDAASTIAALRLNPKK